MIDFIEWTYDAAFAGSVSGAVGGWVVWDITRRMWVGRAALICGFCALVLTGATITYSSYTAPCGLDRGCENADFFMKGVVGIAVMWLLWLFLGSFRAREEQSERGGTTLIPLVAVVTAIGMIFLHDIGRHHHWWS